MLVLVCTSDIHQTLETDEEHPSPMPCPNDRSQTSYMAYMEYHRVSGIHGAFGYVWVLRPVDIR